MRIILTAATVIATYGMITLAPASAANYVAGGALQQNGVCNVATDGGEGFYGYATPCPRPVTIKHTKKSKS